MSEPVSVVIPVHAQAAAVGPALKAWRAALNHLNVEAELLVVDDGSPDATADEAAQVPGVRVVRHETRHGFGTCLKTGLAETRHPLFFYTALDYPYTPTDLGKLLTRIGQTDEVIGRKLDVVSGCRTGRPVPPEWRFLGRVVRGFARYGLGLPLEPLPGWLGLREHRRSWLAWGVFADPLTDPNCAFKLFRRSVFDKFPIQCDGEFVHVELIAKATFTTCLMDEVLLTPKPDPIPKARWGEFWRLFRRPEFYPQADPPTAPVTP